MPHSPPVMACHLPRWPSGRRIHVCHLAGTSSVPYLALPEPGPSSEPGHIAKPTSSSRHCGTGIRPDRDISRSWVALTSPVRLCRLCRLAEAPHAAATAGFSIQEGEIPRETDCLLEGAGFELSVPRQIAKVFRGFVRDDVECPLGSRHRPRRGRQGLRRPLEAERRQIVKSDRVLRRDAPNRRRLKL